MSTQTSISMSASQASSETKESWPGPFATAYEIMSKRDNARKHREEQLALKMEGLDGCVYDEEELDEVDIALKDFHWHKETILEPDKGNICINRSMY